MSNQLAIATVTATLKLALQDIANRIADGARVTTGRPEQHPSGDAQAGINLYLFEVVPNAALRNADLPVRRGDGSVACRPQVALNLHYLLSFYGNEEQLIPQRLLGGAVSMLNAQPLLTRARIEKAIQRSLYLAGSDLAGQPEHVRLTPLSLSLEEISKLWSVFFQTPHALSVAYQAAVVLIEAPLTPQRALPVRDRGIAGVGHAQPLIDAVAAERASDAAGKVTERLVIRGRGLKAELPEVRLGNVPLPIVACTDTRIDAELRPALLRAGLQAVQVLHRVRLESSGATRAAIASNVATWALRPALRLAGAAAPGQRYELAATHTEVRVGIVPRVGRLQRAFLWLNELDAPAERAAYAYCFAAPLYNGLDDPDSARERALARAVEYEAEPELGAAWQIVEAVNSAREDSTYSAVLAAAELALETAVPSEMQGDLRQRAYAAAAEVVAAVASTETIAFPIHDVVPGTYLVRIQIDGVESLLDVDSDPDSPAYQRYSEPQVAIP